MPIGIITDSVAIIIGGVIGALIGTRIKERVQDILNLILGLCAMTIGISSIVLMNNLPVVIFSILAGTGIGMLIHLGKLITAGAGLMQRKVMGLTNSADTQNGSGLQERLVTCVVLFCASGTGIYGSMVAGMTGNHSILLAKSILDVATALIFGCSLGFVVALVVIPSTIVLLLLFLLAGKLYPLCTATMIDDFKACGGMVLLATGLRMCGIKDFPIADMIPAMIIVMPVSAFWTNSIAPLVTRLAGV